MKSWQTPKPLEEFGAIWQTASSDTVFQGRAPPELSLVTELCLQSHQHSSCFVFSCCSSTAGQIQAGLFLCKQTPRWCLTCRITCVTCTCQLSQLHCQKTPYFLNSDLLCPLQHLFAGLLSSSLQWSNSCVIQEVILALFRYFTCFSGLA